MCFSLLQFTHSPAIVLRLNHGHFVCRTQYQVIARRDISFVELFLQLGNIRHRFYELGYLRNIYSLIYGQKFLLRQEKILSPLIGEFRP